MFLPMATVKVVKSHSTLPKSSMEAIKGELASSSLSVTLKKVSASAGGILGAREPDELLRSKQQLYNLKNKMKKVHQVDKLL